MYFNFSAIKNNPGTVMIISHKNISVSTATAFVLTDWFAIHAPAQCGEYGLDDTCLQT